MSVMETIGVLRSLSPEAFRAPASQTTLEALGTSLECRLPPDILALYRDHDGNTDRFITDGRLMSIEEVEAFHETIAPHDFGDGEDSDLWKVALFGRGLRAFWTDDNSNYGAVYVEGPLEGMVRWLYHDSDEDVLYRSVESYYELLAKAAKEECCVLDLPREISEEEAARLLPEAEGRPVDLPDSTGWTAIGSMLRTPPEDVPWQELTASLEPSTVELVRRLRSADWFSSVGQPLDDATVETVSTWEEAVASCTSRNWNEHVHSESVELFRKRVRRQIQKIKKTNITADDWVKLREQLKPITEHLLTLKARGVVEEHNLPRDFVRDVYWMISQSLEEQEFADVVSADFYQRCAEWYLMGRYPCGWKGRFPKSGKLIVF